MVETCRMSRGQTQTQSQTSSGALSVRSVVSSTMGRAAAGAALPAPDNTALRLTARVFSGTGEKHGIRLRPSKVPQVRGWAC